MTPTLGDLVRSFFIDHLRRVKGLKPSSIRSYRDAVRLYLSFTASRIGHPVALLALEHATFDSVVEFLHHLEHDRGNAIPTRNQRLAVLHVLFEYFGSRVPEMLETARRVLLLPQKRCPPPETRFLKRNEVERVLEGVPVGRQGRRDRALLLFLYNTGARAQEVADLRVGHIDWERRSVRLHGKGGKWRVCPLWNRTLDCLRELVEALDPDAPVFRSQRGGPLGRFGIYKLVRRHASAFDGASGPVTPHVFRHTTAVHLLGAGVEPNVIRGWLGHASLATTNRYAEIDVAAKEAALRACEPPNMPEAEPAWRSDPDLLSWLEAL